MNPFRRLRNTLASAIDSIVSQIENHDAIVGAAISALDQHIQAAEAQLSTLRKDSQAFREKIAAVREETTRWRSRAVKLAPIDEPKALQCVKLVLSGDRQVAAIIGQQTDHDRIERQLTDGVNKLHQKIRRLQQQRNHLRTRQTRTDTKHLTQQIDTDTFDQISSIFDRWEKQMAASECVTSDTKYRDRCFDNGVSVIEDHEELKRELDRIVADQKNLTKE